MGGGRAREGGGSGGQVSGGSGRGSRAARRDDAASASTAATAQGARRGRAGSRRRRLTRRFARRDRLTRRLGRLSPRCKRCRRCRPSSCSATATRYPARRAPPARIAPAVRCAARGPALTRPVYGLRFFSLGASWCPSTPTSRPGPTRPPCCSTGCAPAAAAPRPRCAEATTPGPRHESAAHPLHRRRLPARPEAGGAWRRVAACHRVRWA